MQSSYDILPGMGTPVELPTLQNLNPLTDESILGWSGYYGAKSDSGLNVNHLNSLGIPAVNQGVNILASALAQMKVRLVRETRSESGKPKFTEIENHNGAKVAKNRSVNREMATGATQSICTFRATTMNHAVMAGDGWSSIQRDGGGQPLQTTLLPPYPSTRVEFTVDRNKQPKLKVKSEIELGLGTGVQEVELDPINVFQIMNLSHDGLSGYPLYEVAANALGLGLATYKYGGKSFANGTKLSGTLNDPGNPKDSVIRSNQARFYAANSGMDNAGAVPYLTGGTTFQQLSMTNIDAQLVEMLNQSPRLVAQLLNIPPFLLGVTESSGLKMAELIAFFKQFTLSGWSCTWAEEMRLKLLTEEQWSRGKLHFILDFSHFMGVTFPEFVDALVTATGGPILTRDESRIHMKLNPAEDDDEFLERSTGAPVQRSDESPEPPESTEERLDEAENRIANLLRNGLQSLAKVESQKVAAAVEKDDFATWSKDFYGSEWKSRLSALVREEVADEYCSVRRQEVLDLLEKSGRGAVEADLGNYQARGLKLIEAELRANGKNIHAGAK